MTRLLRALVLVVLSLCAAGAARAQLAYTRSSFSGAYAPIAAGTGASTLSFGNLDDGTTSIALPFNFSFAGATWTTGNFLAVVTNGHAFFSASNVTTPFSSNNTSLYTVTAPNATLAPWFDDLSTAAVGSNPAGSVLYQTQGNVGSRTLTVQWTGVSAFSSVAAGQPRSLNFQLVLYEGTNVIEFHYGPTGGSATSSSESASIGIEDGTGGDGRYLDGMTGASHVNNGMMTDLKWPQRFLRFTPGAPTALAAGTYTVGQGGNYETLTDAVADLNQRGVAGAITMALTDAEYLPPATVYPLLLGPVVGSGAASPVTIQGTATLRAEGTAAGTCGNATGTNAIGTSNEPIVGLIGSDYVTLVGLNLEATGSAQVDRGVLVANNSGVDGAGHLTIRDVSITLSRGNGNSIGVQQAVVINPSISSGSNSFNSYLNVLVTNAAGGIHLVGNASIPDANCIIGATVAGGTVIGAATANDIGNGTAQVTGIRAAAQAGVRIYNCEVRNLTGTGTSSVEAIYLDNAGSGLVSVGTCEIANNRVYGLRQTNVAGGVVRGIRINLTGNVGSFSRVYNNLVYDLSSASTTTNSRRVIGINLQDVSSGINATHQVDFNSVRLAPAGLACSNTCFEIGTVSGPKMLVRNNIFANFSAAQNGLAKHYSMATPSATSIGPPGSVFDRNDLYVNTVTNGYVGIASTSDKPTLADWRGVAAGVDANSQAGNPQFIGAADLHIASGLPTPVESAGSYFAGAITWAGLDFDQELRNALTPDIGADEGAFTFLAPADIAAFEIEDPVTGGVKVAGTPFAPRASFQNVGTNTQMAVPVRVKITGPSPDTAEVYNGTALSPTLPVAGPPVAITFPALSLPTPGTYSIRATAELPGDGVPGNDAVAGTFQLAGPLAGSYNVGGTRPPPFHTLTAAIERLNLVGVSGPVTFRLDNSIYQAPAETFPLVISPVVGAGPASPVVIAPAPGKNSTISANVSGAVLRLDGADYVTIDGSNSSTTSRDLTIVNTSTAASTAALWLSSLGPGAGASNNVIKNCIIRCGVDQRSSASETFGILSSGAVLSGSSDGADNDGCVFQNNTITNVRWGIYLRGAALNPNDNGVVVDNVIGPAAFGAGQIGRGGIVLQHQNQTLVTRNEVRSVGVLVTDSAAGSDRVGIGIGDAGWLPAGLTATNIRVVANRIHDIVEEKRFSAVGIVVTGDGAPSGNLIANNMIYAVRSNGTSSDQAVGIGVSGGSADRIVFNSIFLSGDLDPGAAVAATASGCGIRITDTAPADLTLKNNIVSVDLSSNSGTLRHFGVVAPAASFDWGAGGSDNNDYFVNPGNPQMVLGGIGATVPYVEAPSLADWRALFTPNQDAASLATDPRFVGATDLHISAAGPVVPPVSRAGVSIAGVAADFDGEAGFRATNPDIGADEFPTFFLTTSAVGGGTVTALPPGPEFNPGASTALTATPADSCLAFVGWSGGASGTANPLNLTMSSDRSVTATFGQRAIVVTATAGPGGAITPAGAVNVPCGRDTTFAIVADSCHVVADVLVDGQSVGPQTRVTLTQVTTARSVSAVFAPRAFTVTTSAGPGGAITPAGDSNVLCGDSLRVTVTPDSCHRIGTLLVDGQGVVVSPIRPMTMAFNGITANHSVSVTFVRQTYAIQAGAGPGGTITPAGAVDVDCRASRLFVMTPDSCHTIADVVVDGQSVGPVASYTFIEVEAPHTIAVAYAPIVYQIVASTDGGAALEPNGVIPVACGSTQAFTVTPGECRRIDDVLVDDVSLGPVTSFVLAGIREDHTIEVYTGPSVPVILATAGDGGAISPVGAVAVPCGGSRTFAITPGSGYGVLEVTVDGQSVGPVTSYTFSSVRRMHTIHATFVDVQAPTVRLVAPNGGEGWEIGTVQTIAWLASDNLGVTSITLENSLDGGGSWTPIVSGLSNIGSYAWTVPSTPTAQARVRVTARDAAALSGSDSSDASFFIGDVAAAAFLLDNLTRPLLLQNRPNPFNSTTRIGFALPGAAPVRLALYSIDGRLVRTLARREFAAGYHELEWDGRADGGLSMPGGVYFCRFESGASIETHRLVLRP